MAAQKKFDSIQYFDTPLYLNKDAFYKICEADYETSIITSEGFPSYTPILKNRDIPIYQIILDNIPGVVFPNGYILVSNINNTYDPLKLGLEKIESFLNKIYKNRTIKILLIEDFKDSAIKVYVDGSFVAILQQISNFGVENYNKYCMFITNHFIKEDFGSINTSLKDFWNEWLRDAKATYLASQDI